MSFRVNLYLLLAQQLCYGLVDNSHVQLFLFAGERSIHDNLFLWWNLQRDIWLQSSQKEGSEDLKMPLKQTKRCKCELNCSHSKTMCQRALWKMYTFYFARWRYLMQHMKDVLFPLCGHNVFCIWCDGADIKPWLKTEWNKTKTQSFTEKPVRWYSGQRMQVVQYKTSYLFRSSKTSGRRKLSRDHSSDRLFCRGVPVRSSLLSVGNIFSSCTRRQFRFLILWPSSTIK